MLVFSEIQLQIISTLTAGTVIKYAFMQKRFSTIFFPYRSVKMHE